MPNLDFHKTNVYEIRIYNHTSFTGNRYEFDTGAFGENIKENIQ